MRTKMKIPLLFSFLIAIGLLIIPTSCEEDYETIEEPLIKNQNLRIEVHQGEHTLNENPFLRSILSDVKTKKEQSRLISTTYNFAIEEELVQVLTGDDYIQYTFVVERENPQENVLENYVCKIMNNGLVYQYIIQYPYTLVNGDKNYIASQTHIIPIQNPDFVNTTSFRINCPPGSVPYLVDTSEQEICYSTRCNGGGNHKIGENCECLLPESHCTPASLQCNTTTIFNWSCGGGGGAGDGNTSDLGTVGGSGTTGSSTPTIITVPFISQNMTEQKLLQSFTTLEQSNWWLFVASDETKEDILNYLNQNTTNNVVDTEALQFVKELMDYSILEGNTSDSQEEINNILDLIDDGKVNGNEVVVGPDTPITDMADYLSCFDTSQSATITIYADQPKSGSHNLLGPDRVGHAFISIQQGSNMATLGFYPESSVGSIVPNSLTLDPTDFLPTPGVFGNDQGHTYDVSLTVPINSGGLTNLINGLISVAASNPVYNLGSSNCTDIALLLFESTTSIDIPNCNSPRPYWNGQTPGTLGEVIRTMPTPAGGTKNTNEGNAPNNNCN
jgi:hypothetical protein